MFDVTLTTWDFQVSLHSLETQAFWDIYHFYDVII